MIAQSISCAAEQLAQRLVGDARQLQALGQIELDLLLAARRIRAGLVPVHVGQLHAHLVVHPAAHIDGGRMRPFGRADLLALQVLDRFDPALLVHVERREAEQPRADHRKADDVAVLARDLGRELREGELGEVELAIGGEAREAFVMAEIEPGVIDPLGLDEAQAEIAEVIVIRGRDRKLQVRHSFPLADVCFQSLSMCS